MKARSRKSKLDSRDFGFWEPVRAASWRCPSGRGGRGELLRNMLVWSLQGRADGDRLYLGTDLWVAKEPKVEGQYPDLWKG